MLQRLPVHDPMSLVLLNDDISEGVGSGDLVGEAVSYPFYQDLQAHDASFQDLCAFRQGEDNVMHARLRRARHARRIRVGPSSLRQLFRCVRRSSRCGPYAS